MARQQNDKTRSAEHPPFFSIFPFLFIQIEHNILYYIRCEIKFTIYYVGQKVTMGRAYERKIRLSHKTGGYDREKHRQHLTNYFSLKTVARFFSHSHILMLHS